MIQPDDAYAEQPVARAAEDDPPPPPGYQPPYRFIYPAGKLTLLSVGIAFVGTPALMLLTWWAQGSPDPLSVTLDGGDMLVVVLTIVLTVVVHELIHGAVMGGSGYRVSYGIFWQLGGFYTAAFKQFVTRDHTITIALAPLLVITPLGIVLLLLPVGLAVIVGLTALLINTTGAIGDIYLTWRLLRLPRTTLLYDVSIERMLIYEPDPA